MRSRAPRSAAVALMVGFATAATLAAGSEGCGGNAASATASASETTHDRAETRAFADGVNLRRADLPGFKVVFAGEEGRPGPLGGEAESCDGGPTLDAASHGDFSPLMQNQSSPVQTLLSGVFRLPSPADAGVYVGAADDARGLRCIEAEEAHKQSTLSPRARLQIEVSTLRGPLGAPAISAVRVWRCLKGPRPCNDRKVRGFTDRIWFSTGRYVVALFYIVTTTPPAAKGPAAVALPLERRLAALLHRRASSHATSVALRGLRTKSG